MDVSIGCLRCWYFMLIVGQVPVFSFEPLCSTLCDARHIFIAELFVPSIEFSLLLLLCRGLRYLLVPPRHGACVRAFIADSW